jgi:hypothetical protein
MNIRQIYRKFNIPPNLQEHMLRVASVVEFLQKHWIGKDKVNWKLTKNVALLHDLGNLVKPDLIKHPEVLDKERINISHWLNVRQKLIENYGTDDHEVTLKMLSEIGSDKSIVDIISKKGFANSVLIKNSSNWPLKILHYADLRTLPSTIGGLEERIADIRARMPKYTERSDFEDLVAACQEIEKQIRENLDVPVSEINNTSISKFVPKYPRSI